MFRLAESTTGKELVRLHRLEFPFPVLYLCYSVWGACYAVGDASGLLSLPVLAAVVTNVLLALAGLALNTAADIRTDTHHPERWELAKHASRFGPTRLRRWAIAEMVIAFALSPLSGHWAVPATAGAIIALHVLYNVEPVRLKRRGFVGVLAFCAAVVTLPAVLSYEAVRTDLPASTWLVFVGAGILSVGRMAWWSVPDRAADAATGMGTPSVRYGAAGALALSVLIMLAGLGVVGTGLWSLFGSAWVLLALVPHAVFLAGAVARSTSRSSVRMRTRDLPVVTLGEVALAVVALLAV